MTENTAPQIEIMVHYPCTGDVEYELDDYTLFVGEGWTWDEIQAVRKDIFEYAPDATWDACKEAGTLSEGIELYRLTLGFEPNWYEPNGPDNPSQLVARAHYYIESVEHLTAQMFDEAEKRNNA